MAIRSFLPSWLALGLLGVACGGPAADSYRIEIDSSLPVSIQITTDESPAQQVCGLEYGVVGGEFRIGETNYGSVPQGALIEVGPAGVTVAGELRGPLPEG